MEPSSFASVLEKDGELFYTAIGKSMYPLILQKEDMVHIRLLNRPLRKGDVVLYKRDEHHFVLHRILKLKKDGRIILAGDYNSWKDEPITKDMILGILVDVTKKDGKVIDMEKDYKVKAWFYTHFFYSKAFWFKVVRHLKPNKK